MRQHLFLSLSLRTRTLFGMVFKAISLSTTCIKYAKTLCTSAIIYSATVLFRIHVILLEDPQGTTGPSYYPSLSLSTLTSNNHLLICQNMTTLCSSL